MPNEKHVDEFYRQVAERDRIFDIAVSHFRMQGWEVKADYGASCPSEMPPTWVSWSALNVRVPGEKFPGFTLRVDLDCKISLKAMKEDFRERDVFDAIREGEDIMNGTWHPGKWGKEYYNGPPE